MPTGLAVMTRAGLSRPLLGAALAVAGVLVPLDPGAVPEPLSAIAGDSPAAAQAVIESGSPSPCPSGWRPSADGADCRLEIDACPASPPDVGGALTPSVAFPSPPELAALDIHGAEIHRYPGFCEVRLVEKDDAAAYDACTRATGFIRMTHEMEVSPDDPSIILHMCRLVTPAACAAGSEAHRVRSTKCRAISRRTWTCAPGFAPRNEFNSCYRLPDAHTGSHPACGEGAPTFVARDCADYVGNDYVRDPDATLCTRFEMGGALAMTPNTLAGTAGAYWCEFNAAYLTAACHGAAPPPADCAPSTGRCLKRASDTGGCTAIARTVRCRGLQAAYLEDTKTVQEINAAGCQPCVFLPFQPLPPSCPDALRAAPATLYTSQASKYETLHRVRESFNIDHIRCAPVRNGADLADHADCRNTPVCLGAPRGYLTWEGTHGSGLAVVNAPVVLRVSDIPTDVATVIRLGFSQPARLRVASFSFLRFADDAQGDPLVRVWPRIDSADSFTRVSQFMGGSGTCLVDELPRFKARVTELWPDVPEAHAEIRALFGEQTLDWWDALAVEDKRRNTEARGLTFWDDLTTNAERNDEREQRSVGLEEEIDCNVGAEVWCRWLPRRPGYFKAIAAGAWVMKQSSTSRQWINPDWNYTKDLVKFLAEPANTPTVRDLLNQHGLTAEQAGLTPDLLALLPTVPADGGVTGSRNFEWLYTAAAGAHNRCPTSDLRQRSCGSSRAGNYTETEPVAILVQEVRVATRPVNR